MNEKEKKAIIYFDETLTNKCDIEFWKRVKNLIDKQQKEIEEKRIIIFAGAEKVKQLEKGNRSLMESRKKWKNRYYKEKAKNKDFISKDKIREKIKKYQEKAEDVKQKYKGVYAYKDDYLEALAKIEGYQELLEE